MNCRALVYLSVFAATLLVDVWVYAAGFDCNKASIAAEKMICRNDELSKLDEELTVAYLVSLERF